MQGYEKVAVGRRIIRVEDWNGVNQFHVFNIRKKVFVEEQKVNRDEEYDEFENTSQHYLGWEGRSRVATARWRHTSEGVKLERFAVLNGYRNKGMGTDLLKKVLADAREEGKNIYLHAQLPAVSLYERAGFVKEGEMFSECGIEHYKMVYKW